VIKMRTKKSFSLYVPSVIILFSLLLICSISLQAQVIWENPKYEIYGFLSRQAQKGNIQLFDFTEPISRKEIALHLSSLRDSLQKLSITERKELEFYQKEYSEFSNQLTDTLRFLKKDDAGRWRFISINKKDYLFRGDPILTLATIQSKNSSVFKKGNGIQFWGQIGKHIAYQASFEDITESGTGLDSLKKFTSEPGIVRTSDAKPNAKTLNYSDLRAGISYSWQSGSLILAKDQLLTGYGENGRLILSDKAPAYPFIRLDYQPLKWLSFNYSNAWLQSNIIDSARTYSNGNTVYGGKRETYVPKFMATHSLNLFPVKGLALSLGESIIYSDRLDIGYLIPIMFFKAYDHYASKYKISTGSNGQFFFQASSRNNIPNTHLYSTLFIDEIRLSSVFNRQKSRNQLGFNIGASVTDVFLPYLTLGSEYTRVNPFVYQNLIAAQTYTSQGYSLGDWMGNNADRLIIFVKYTPLARLKTQFQIQKIRKGAAGTIEDQYFAEPQPDFLFNLQKEYTELKFKLSYEWINNLYLQGSITSSTEKNIPAKTSNKLSQFNFSVSFGL